MIGTNPYRPGAGMRPLCLAGRDNELEEARNILISMVNSVPTNPLIYNGLRGVGKTVLLNAIESIAEDEGVIYAHIESDAKRNFISQLTTSTQSILRDISAKEAAKLSLTKVMDALKTLSISFDAKNTTFTVTPSERDLYASSNIETSITDLFVQLGKVAYEQNTSVCFFLDELQFMKVEHLSAVITALHRVNQLGYPLSMFAAGLPKVFKLLGDAKSYAERLFIYREIGNIDRDACIDAIRVPAEGMCQFSDDAITQIIDLTKGYPYFIQVLCKILWDASDSGSIDLQDVVDGQVLFYKELDGGFFRVRFDRCTEGERAFLYAMVDCGELPCTIANVAGNLNRSVSSISPIRAQLINKGVIYPTGHGEIDFTVPEFDKFLTRNR